MLIEQDVLTFNFYDSTRVIFLPPKQKPHLWARADFREGWSQRSSDEFFLFQAYPAMEQNFLEALLTLRHLLFSMETTLIIFSVATQ